MSPRIKTAFAWAYGIQCFMVVPWFLGAFARDEMSPSPWVQFPEQLQRHGIGDALFQLYLYALFYALPAVLTWVYLPHYFRRELRVVLSVWVGGTFFIFLPSILQVADRGWLFVVWLAVSVLVVRAAVSVIRQSRHDSDA